MKTTSKVLSLASAVFCLLLLLVASPSIAQCGPGGAGCEGCTGTCSGVACAIPGQHTPSSGPCTAAQLAAGGWEISTVSNCAGSLAGVCKCYLPSFYQITQQNCARVYFSSQSWEKPTVLASSEACATPETLMTPATPPTTTSPALAEAPDENEPKAGAS